MARKKKNLELGLNATELTWIERVKHKYSENGSYGYAHEEFENVDKKFGDFYSGALICSIDDPKDQHVIVAADTIQCTDHTHNIFFEKKIGLSALGKVKRLRSYDDFKLSDRQFEDSLFSTDSEFDYRKEIRENNTRIQRVKRANRPWLLKFKMESEANAFFDSKNGQEMTLYVLKIEEQNAHKIPVKFDVVYGYVTMMVTGNTECISISTHPSNRPQKQCDHTNYNAGFNVRQQMQLHHFLRFIKQHDVYTKLPVLE